MSQSVRILLSPQSRQALATPIAAVMGERQFELLTVADLLDSSSAQTGVDLAFISREVTGLSTKHETTVQTQAFYDALRRSSDLQWLHIHSAGADRPIYLELRARGVQVSTSSGANAEVVAQTALAGLLALARRFPQLMAAQREQRWAPLVNQLPRDLAGQTAVIVGWGPIGQRVGEFLKLLGLKLIVVRRELNQVAGPGIETVSFTQLHSVLPRADWLLLACPLTDQTRGLVNAQVLAALPPAASLINVARGEVVVEQDLIDALHQGRLGGAFLDVFQHEPLRRDSALWGLDNVIVTPHSAGHSDGNPRRVADIFMANLARWQAGQALQNCIA
ncbi:MAG: D-2-hydroxyacid dehydrogenase [Burkholderiaceae bacterium]